MTARKQQTQQLGPETWGEKFARVHRRSRERTGMTFQDVADALTAVGKDCAESALYKLTKFTDVPARMPTRQRAYLALLVYGYDPGEFGLTIENSGLQSWNPKILSDLGKLSSGCTSELPATAA